MVTKKNQKKSNQNHNSHYFGILAVILAVGLFSFGMIGMGQNQNLAGNAKQVRAPVLDQNLRVADCDTSNSECIEDAIERGEVKVRDLPVKKAKNTIKSMNTFFCMESDESASYVPPGNNPSDMGVITFGGPSGSGYTFLSIADFCVTPTHLAEFYCNGTTPNYQYTDCNGDCVNGECVSLPDYAITYFGVPTTVYVGDVVEYNVSIKNFGAAASTSSLLKVYSPFGDMDWTIPALAQSETVTETGYINCSVPGTMYLNATADYFGQIAESDETNNYDVGTVECVQPPSLPDLVVDVSAPSSSVNGSYFWYNVTVSNIGAGNVNLWTDLQLTTLIAQSETSFNHSVVPLVSGDSVTFPFMGNCLIPGTMYLNATVDYFDQIIESNELNNYDVGTVECVLPPSDPDLTLELSAPSSVTVGDQYTVQVTTHNAGAGDVSSNFYDFVVVYPPVGASSFNLSNWQPIYSLPAGQSYTYNLTYTCQSAGLIQVMGNTDYYGAIGESNEYNNNDSIVISCVQPSLPDLVVDVNAPSVSVNGSYFWYNVTVSNIGAGAANISTNLQIFTLMNQYADLSYFPVAPLVSGDSVTFPVMGNCSQIGGYNITAFVDWTHLLTESQEGNNFDEAYVGCI